MSGQKDIKPKIWILEDEEPAIFKYRKVLIYRYDLKFFKDLASFEKEISNTNNFPDLVIADLCLGESFFLNSFNSKKDKFPKFPFMIVSSVDDERVINEGLEMGALEYLTKPYNPNELLVKVGFALKKKTQREMLPLDVNDEFYGLIISSKVKEKLTNRERELLKLFFASKEKIITRDEIFERVLEDVTVQDGTINTHICNLRKKIELDNYKIKNIGSGKWKLTIPEFQPIG